MNGCIISAAGPVYSLQIPRGEEQEIIGVVNGLWKYDVAENRRRLDKWLPKEGEEHLRQLGNRYQVRLGVKRSIVGGSAAAEVAILPEGWTFTTKANATIPTVVQPGDLVVIMSKKGRAVDKVIKLYRRCDESQKEKEKPELSIGCFEVKKFRHNGYGGKWYFWTAF